MSSILVVDDDEMSLVVIRNALRKEGHEVQTYDSPQAALAEYEAGRYDLVISDYFMPELNGDDLLERVRRLDGETPFVFLTANTDIKLAIELVKSGADDHIVKPIVAEELVFRVNKNLQERENRRVREEAERERQLLELENQRLVNWRNLYATKDIKQTEQMIDLLGRTVNQSGGYLWLDLLKGDLEEADDEHYKVGKELVQMIVTAAESQKQIFDYITFIGRIDELEMEFEEHDLAQFIKQLDEYMRAELAAISKHDPRRYVPMTPKQRPSGVISVSEQYFLKVVRELLINAVKYSLPGTRIITSFDTVASDGDTRLEITVRNVPRPLQAKDSEGRQVVGVPYEYCELVFDLFYTIEAFPTYFEGEDWSDGTGLYLARKLIAKHGGWMQAANAVNYTGDSPETFTKFTVTVPYKQRSS